MALLTPMGFFCLNTSTYLFRFFQNHVDPTIMNPVSKVHGTNMGSIWGREDPGGPHVGPMNFAIWEVSCP